MSKRILITLLAITSIFMTAACGDDDAKTDGPSQPDGGGDTKVISDGVVPDGAPPDGAHHDIGPQSDTQEPDLPQGPSAKILEARTAADGAVNIVIGGVYVTYVKATHGDDAAGFTIQYEQKGPALFIAVDATTLTPAPAAGDLVSLTLTEMATNQGRREATALSNLSVTSNDNPLAPLMQDLTNASDLISALDSYDAELITLQGTLTGEFAAAGSGFVSATMDTGALTNQSDIKLRLPRHLQQILAMTTGCTFSLKGTPLWRYNGQAQPSAGVEADIEVTSCPAPKVVSAIALSSTTLRVTFDHAMAPTSVNANGDQFTFDNGLTASAATLSGSEAEITTSAQSVGTTYTVTVATTVTDSLGTALDGAANTATFAGYRSGATLRINEVNPDILNGCDLVEIRVIEGGTLSGYKLLYRDQLALYFPLNMVVTKNEYLVVHFDADDDTHCYPVLPPNEVENPDDVITTGSSSPYVGNTIPNFDTAYDLYSTIPGMSYTSATLSIVDPAGTIVDALLYSEASSDAPATTTLSAANTIAAANAWTPVGGSARVSYDAATFTEDAAKYARNPSGERNYDKRSLQRANDADGNTSADWTNAHANPSWGTNNSGQSDL